MDGDNRLVLMCQFLGRSVPLVTHMRHAKARDRALLLCASIFVPSSAGAWSGRGAIVQWPATHLFPATAINLQSLCAGRVQLAGRQRPVELQPGEDADDGSGAGEGVAQVVHAAGAKRGRRPLPPPRTVRRTVQVRCALLPACGGSGSGVRGGGAACAGIRAVVESTCVYSPFTRPGMRTLPGTKAQRRCLALRGCRMTVVLTWFAVAPCLQCGREAERRPLRDCDPERAEGYVLHGSPPVQSVTECLIMRRHHRPSPAPRCGSLLTSRLR